MVNMSSPGKKSMIIDLDLNSCAELKQESQDWDDNLSATIADGC